MKKLILGNTGIEVTELCFGTLPIGPLQLKLDLNNASEVIAYALRSGITYVDTAKMYNTYEHLRLAMEKSRIRPVISSKSTAVSYDDMERDVQDAITALGIDYIDIFFLHAARAGQTVFAEREPALNALIECKRKGMIRAIGISTHNVRVTSAAAHNPDIDIVFPIINIAGRGVLEGTAGEMANAIEECQRAGKGLVLMKALGGGSLINDYKNAMDYVLNLSKARASVALGMVSKQEVDMNIAYFNGEAPGLEQIRNKRFLIVESLCLNCGKCAIGCPNGAISIVNGQMTIDDSKCITCGYCVGTCGEFAIRMI